MVATADAIGARGQVGARARSSPVPVESEPVDRAIVGGRPAVMLGR
jgi:hypothetical protein